jgi:lysophospholipase L1-like esterase
MFVTFAANYIGLSESGSLSRGKALLFLVGLIVFLVGLFTRENDWHDPRSFFERLKTLYKSAALLTFNTVVLLICLEAIATIFFKASSLLSKPATTPTAITSLLRAQTAKSAESSYYTSQAWASKYWYEHFLVAEKSSSGNYFPYVIWRRAPFNGETINIDQQGIRKTPGTNCVPGAYKVFTFGGSTMWGYGAPDWGTIPANLQTDLAKLTRKPLCIINYADMAYVSTQGVIELMLQLQAGNIPDLVIFYDGINDTDLAYREGRVDRHFYTDQIAARFEGKDNNNGNTLADWLKSSASFTLFKTLVFKLLPEQTTPELQTVDYRSFGIDKYRLSDSVVQEYLANYEIVDALSQKYSFKSLFFWQPVISIGKKSLTNEEEQFLSAMTSPRVDFFDVVYKKIERDSIGYQNLYYIADVFDQKKDQIWIDWEHVTPVGNQLVARSMLDIIEQSDLIK